MLEPGSQPEPHKAMEFPSHLISWRMSCKRVSCKKAELLPCSLRNVTFTSSCVKTNMKCVGCHRNIMQKQLFMGYRAITFPMSAILFTSSFSRSSKAIVSWNPWSFKILGTDMLYWLRNGVIQLSKATGQELKSWPVRTTPQRTEILCICPW